MKLNTLLDQSKTNHYKMLVVVDNSHQHDKIISSLKKVKGWSSYDVTEEVLRLLESIPTERKIGRAHV